MDGEVAQQRTNAGVSCAPELTFRVIDGLPPIAAGDDLAALLCRALSHSQLAPRDCDVIVVSSKLVAKAENRYVDLQQVKPSDAAHALAARTGKDPRAVEVMLWDCERISRAAPGVLVVRHHGGHVSANAGIDQSNALPSHAQPGSGPWLLRLPEDPDASATRLRERLQAVYGVGLGVIVSDSFGRPFRRGSVGVAIGSAGLPALYDQRGQRDLDGRALEHTETATADQIEAASDLICGQACEGRGAALVRGLQFTPNTGGARELCRPAEGDLYL
jgi:coenzyme F420-0:L-glutamate ligase/coenzyme F420-1:gamma-L-glutamate ligase